MGIWKLDFSDFCLENAKVLVLKKILKVREKYKVIP